ncbi:hypothetical protein N7447_004941 [Penicillium robsamsonii]|uniref:uncharacterized protein n=1 Tax=Penicillium robsamsonii TaxID=1792511 RepID=UPI0025491B45|nr:uncharacterized protein N7447_004941 [Penicillium robsamsonii]KAJ5822601.1 hypothetical protein N7447_004941 [Penicillium robsamsonii]
MASNRFWTSSSVSFRIRASKSFCSSASLYPVDLEKDKGVEEEHKEGPNRKDQAVRIVDFDIADFDIVDFDIVDFDIVDFDIADFDIVDFDIVDFDIADFDIADFDIADFDIADFDIADLDTPEDSDVAELVDSYFCADKKSGVPAMLVDDLMGVGASWEHSACLLPVPGSSRDGTGTPYWIALAVVHMVHIGILEAAQECGESHIELGLLA